MQAKIIPITRNHWYNNRTLKFILFIYLILCCFLLQSCGEKKKDVTVQPRQDEVVAVWTNPDGTKQIDIMLRVITKNVVYDSARGKDVIKIDSVWGFPKNIDTIIDGKPIKQRVFVQIDKSLVNWRIEGRPVAELLKKDSVTKK